MRRLLPLALLGAAASLTACSNIVDNRGFAPTPGSVEKIEVGSQSREDVVRLIGSPSAVATFNTNVWYYVSQRQETWAFLRPELAEQKVLQITFNDAGRVQDIKQFGLNEAKEIDMVSRATPTAGRELTFMEQILGNIGRFSGPRQSGNPGASTGGGN
ncbi:MAG: outer membrane protein assembly factor BamE [Alphaproteobacteria bacterium]|nr:outer membrane protein assembly factor BamE [Alphaproteobacteria bacterium]